MAASAQNAATTQTAIRQLPSKPADSARNHISGKRDVVEFVPIRSASYGRKFKLPCLTGIRRYVGAVHRVSLS